MTASGTIRGIALAGDLVKNENTAAPDSDFAGLVGRQTRFVFRVAFAILRNTQDAEDVVQETFLRLHRGRRWREIRDERAFLARTAWRIAQNRLRRRSKDKVVVEYPASTACPEGSAIAMDSVALVERLIDSLPEELRQPLVLSGIEELNNRQIAEALNTTEAAVRARISRARRILREKMERGYGL